MNKYQRESQIELLRIIAMFCILFWHVKSHFMGDMVDYHNIYISLLMPIISIHVNLFVLISGYFGISLKIKSLYILWAATFFYALINIFVDTCVPLDILSNKSILYQLLFPLSNCDWWFIKVYVLLIFCSPLLNYIIDNLKSKRQWYKVLSIILILNFYFSFLHKSEYIAMDGADLMNFITLYFIGRYISIVGVNIKRSKIVVIILSIILLKTLLLALGYYSDEIKSYLFLNSYNNPINVIYAAFVFLFFASLKFKSKLINSVGVSALAVYLLTDHIVIRSFFRNVFNEYFHYISNYNQIIVFFILLMFAIILFILTIFIDKIRLLLFYPIDKIISKISGKYYLMKYKVE